MTINRTSTATTATWSEPEQIHEGHNEMVEGARQPSLSPQAGTLHALARTRSLPARGDAPSAGGDDASRPRRLISRSLSQPGRGASISAEYRGNIGAPLVTWDEAPAAEGHRVHVNDATELASQMTDNGQSPPTALSVGGLVKAFAKMTDVRTLLSQADDREFIAGLRVSSIDERGHGAQLGQLMAHVTELKARIDEAGLDLVLATRFKTRLQEVCDTLNTLQTDKPLHEGVAKIASLNLLLAPLPLLIPLMTKPRQQKTEAEIVALMAKAMVEGIGMMRTPTTDNNLLKDRAMARFYANLVQAVEFALPTFVSSLRFLNNDVKFNVAAGAVSTGALFGGFLAKEIREKYNIWRTGSAHPDLHQAGLTLTAETKAALEAVRTAVEMDREALNATKAAFVADDRRELTPYVSKQVTIAVDAYQRLADELADCIGLPPTETPAEHRDRSAKLALAVFSTAVCVATTVLMLPDTIGTVDLASDAAFTSALMFSLMANKNVSRKDALEEFKTFVGLSLVMLAVLAANKAANDFIEHGVSGLLVGSITMAALNLTMPGPVGYAAARAIEKLMSMPPPDLMAGLKNIGNRVFQMFAAEAQPRHPSSVTIEELPADLEAGLPA
ncbi:hypothetical protein [Burkholderia lata]|uniref:hypothetical protein n=1 Tax=Burkholderia lata (strain ATCC 17760 / DSM 23089 / LMG 22485 / NCIMB 9086 / R18194 / 383) TaxID=482957 RepID=UPI0015833694|nr:hypothetical protein [Burkholderia lata]